MLNSITVLCTTSDAAKKQQSIGIWVHGNDDPFDNNFLPEIPDKIKPIFLDFTNSLSERFQFNPLSSQTRSSKLMGETPSLKESGKYVQWTHYISKTYFYLFTRTYPKQRVVVQNSDDESHGPILHFQWLGEPNEEERVLAGERLKMLIQDLVKEETTSEKDVHIHLFAHSHGGNVVGHALASLSSDISVKSVSLLSAPSNPDIWTKAIGRVEAVFNYFSNFDILQTCLADAANMVDSTVSNPNPINGVGKSHAFLPDDFKVTNVDVTSMTTQEKNGELAHAFSRKPAIVPLLVAPMDLVEKSNYSFDEDFAVQPRKSSDFVVVV